MILGLDRNQDGQCFAELDAAVSSLTTRTVCFNAHAFPEQLPKDAVVFNLENVGTQVPRTAFEGHEIWDFSERNVKAWARANVKHVPIGYHPSMERFQMRPWEERDIDVILVGSLNARREKVLRELVRSGLHVWVVPPGTKYGAERDEMLSRSKLAINMLHTEGNLYPTLRAAHLAANRVPMLSENAPGIPRWAHLNSHKYDDLARACMEHLTFAEILKERDRESPYVKFRREPLTLPEDACGAS